MEGASERAGPSNPSNALRIAVLLPVFNDWTPLSRLLSQLDETLDANGLSADAFVIDDGSYEWAPSDLGSVQRRSLTEIVMVRLRRNLWHQRAIAIGLALVAHKSRYSTVVVMDADGQGVFEDECCRVKADLVLRSIAPALFFVPLEAHEYLQYCMYRLAAT